MILVMNLFFFSFADYNEKHAGSLEQMALKENVLVEKQDNAGKEPHKSLIRGAIPNEKGWVAIIPFSDYHYIHLYNEAGNYQFSFYVDGGSGGSFCLEWQSDTIITYWNRNDLILSFDLDGNIRSIDHYDHTLQKHIDEVDYQSNFGRFSLSSGCCYRTEAPFPFLSDTEVRSKVIRKNPEGIETVIYQTSETPFILACIVIIAVSGFICIIILDKRLKNRIISAFFHFTSINNFKL